MRLKQRLQLWVLDWLMRDLDIDVGDLHMNEGFDEETAIAILEGVRANKEFVSLLRVYSKKYARDVLTDQSDGRFTKGALYSSLQLLRKIRDAGQKQSVREPRAPSSFFDGKER